MKQVILVVGILLLLVACGKKGPLIPPEAMAPAPIDDLRASQIGERYLLCFSTPDRDEVGRPLDDLAGVRMLKREILPPGEDCEVCPNVYQLYRVVDLDPYRDTLRYGSVYCLFDSDLELEKTYRYKAVSIRRDDTLSRDSNKVTRKFVPPPAAPVLQGISTEAGVVLEWAAPSDPAAGTLVGFNIYRSESADRVPLRPLNAVPVREMRYLDNTLELAVTYYYSVRAVAEVGKEMVESLPSNKVAGGFSFPEE